MFGPLTSAINFNAAGVAVASVIVRGPDPRSEKSASEC